MPLTPQQRGAIKAALDANPALSDVAALVNAGNDQAAAQALNAPTPDAVWDDTIGYPGGTGTNAEKNSRWTYRPMVTLDEAMAQVEDTEIDGILDSPDPKRERAYNSLRQSQMFNPANAADRRAAERAFPEPRAKNEVPSPTNTTATRRRLRKMAMRPRTRAEMVLLAALGAPNDGVVVTPADVARLARPAVMREEVRRLDGQGNPVLDAEGNPIIDVVEHTFDASAMGEV